MEKSKKERYINWLKTGQVEKFNRYRNLLYRHGVYNIDLKNANLESANMINVNLANSNLKNANMKNANLYNSNMKYANLENSDLYNANLENANINNINLCGADLTGANLLSVKGKHIYKTTGNGSIGREIWYILEDDYVQAGCFNGTLDEFEKQVEEIYGRSKKNYRYQSYQDVIEYYKKKKNRYDK